MQKDQSGDMSTRGTGLPSSASIVSAASFESAASIATGMMSSASSNWLADVESDGDNDDDELGHTAHYSSVGPVDATTSPLARSGISRLTIDTGVPGARGQEPASASSAKTNFTSPMRNVRARALDVPAPQLQKIMSGN